MHATQSICNTSIVQAIHYDFRPNELISLYVNEHVTLWTSPLFFRSDVVYHAASYVVPDCMVVLIGRHTPQNPLQLLTTSGAIRVSFIQAPLYPSCAFVHIVVYP